MATDGCHAYFFAPELHIALLFRSYQPDDAAWIRDFELTFSRYGSAILGVQEHFEPYRQSSPFHSTAYEQEVEGSDVIGPISRRLTEDGSVGVDFLPIVQVDRARRGDAYYLQHPHT